jgi:hypothetical protein
MPIDLFVSVCVCIVRFLLGSLLLSESVYLSLCFYFSSFLSSSLFRSLFPLFLSIARFLFFIWLFASRVVFVSYVLSAVV